MRHLVVIAVLAAILTLGLDVARGPAAPALNDKPVKWEFAELQYRGFQAQAPAALMGPGGRLGVVVGGPPPVAAPAPQNAVQWITADEEIEAAGWKELADKLKAPAAKAEGSATMHRLRVLNRLSADGWEIHEHASTYSWTFRRRVQ